MNNRKLRYLLFLIPFSVLFSACATRLQDHPTHYWQAEKAKTEREYRIDNGACHEQFGIDETTPMPFESPSFEAYRNCMIEKGYVLRSHY